MIYIPLHQMQQAFVSQNSNICAAVCSERSCAHKLKAHRTCDNENLTGVFFFDDLFFVVIFLLFCSTHDARWGKLFTLCYCSTIIQSMRPLKKTVAVDKENIAPTRGAGALEDTASSNENKASCKSRPSRDRQTQAFRKPTTNLKWMNVLTVIKTVQRIEALKEHHWQHTSMQTMYICFGFKNIFVEQNWFRRKSLCL